MYPSSETERLGVAAGVVAMALQGGLLFVGPWRVFAVETGATVPVREVGNSGVIPFGAGIVGVLFVGFVTGAAHPFVVADPEADHGWGDLAMGIFAPSLVTALLAFLVLLLVPAAESLLAGAVGEAAGQAAVGVIFTAFFATTVGTVLAVVVGVPALAGVYVGTLVGSAAAPD